MDDPIRKDHDWEFFDRLLFLLVNMGNFHVVLLGLLLNFPLILSIVIFGHH